MLKALAGLKEKFLVIAGSGHVDFIYENQICIVTVRDGAEVQFIKNQEFGKYISLKMPVLVIMCSFMMTV